MKYIVEKIEEGKVTLMEIDSKKMVVKDAKDLPRIVIGDIIYHDEEEDMFIIDTKSRVERMKNIREELNDILDMED